MIGLRDRGARRSRGGRGGLLGWDEEVLQRPGQQRNTRPDTECKRNLERQGRGHKGHRQYGADEQKRPALRTAVAILVAGQIHDGGIGFGFLIRHGAIGEVLLAQLGARRNIWHREVSR
jgi:hypothetical protein